MNFQIMIKKFCGLCLVLAMVFAMAMPVSADNIAFEKVDDDVVSATLLEESRDTDRETDSITYKNSDIVRVSIVLSAPSAMEQGFTTMGLSANNQLMTMTRQSVKTNQLVVTNLIEKAIADKLDVVWNLTYLTNLISANVEYGQIETIKKVKGVEDVIIEQRIVPMAVEEDGNEVTPSMAISNGMIGVNKAWDSQYYGAGKTVAIIDSGLDLDHQSFDEGAYQYALRINAQYAMADGSVSSPQEYYDSLDLLDKADLEEILPELNVYDRMQGASLSNISENLYKNQKVPFGFNYCDDNYDVTHDNDTQGNHGTHVAGISAANRYIPTQSGYTDALDAVNVAGNAPDAQIIVMKIFGQYGAYESDIFTAIEDATIMGVDTVNLSLGVTSPGFANMGSYQQLMENVKNTDTTVVVSAGNQGDWSDMVDNSAYLGDGYLYTTDTNTNTLSTPGSATNSLTIASVQNQGMIAGSSMVLNGDKISFSGSHQAPAAMNDFSVLDTSPQKTGTEYDYVFLETYGAPGDLDGIDVKGKIVLIQRGMTISFVDKANLAAGAGAAGVIIYDNVSGEINMGLDDYKYETPCNYITKENGQKFKDAGTKVTVENGKEYYAGKVTIQGSRIVTESNKGYYTMSDFSCWGVTGDLALKPEITAPGGNIYSVKGGTKATDPTNRYMTMSGTSMAAPQIAGIGALVNEYMEDKGYSGEFADPRRGLQQSIMMSTAIPMKDNGGRYYPLMRQGAGLVDASAATSADSYIKMGCDATPSYDDGKVKAELGDDPTRSGVYTFTFEIRNLDNNARSYDLSVDAFTQDYFEGPVDEGSEEKIEYMSKSTRALDAVFTFKVDGKEVESITVDANGKVKVEVTVAVTEKEKNDFLEVHFPNGTYIQAYIFVTPKADAEGALSGTSHSIPMFAFYGNWTDASMYYGGSTHNGEVISNYSHGKTSDYSRPQYYAFSGQVAEGVWEDYIPENYFTAVHNGSSYALGGNPLVADDIYMPERDAVSGGVSITYLNYNILRNTSSRSITITNIDQDEVYYNFVDQSDKVAAYKNNYGSAIGWYKDTMDFTLSDAAEGETVEFALTCLPEYYEKGNMGENSTPGKGAVLSVTAVVDNTLPKALDIELNATEQSILVTAEDNRYVSAVVLYNATGDQILSYEGAKQQIEPGESAEYRLNYGDAEDRQFLLQVFDYAMNMSTYRISVEESEMIYSGAMMVYNQDDEQWAITGEDAKSLKPLSVDSEIYNAATSIGSKVFAVNDKNELYVLTAPALDDGVFVDIMEETLVELAYNAADGYIYGVSEENEMVRIEPATGRAAVIGELPFITNTLACDNDGIFYSNKYGTGEIYSYTIDTITTNASQKYDINGDGTVDLADSQALLDYVSGKITAPEGIDQGDFDKDGDVDTYDVYLLNQSLPHLPELLAVAYTTESRYLQAMECDPNSGKLYWASYFTDQMQDDEIAFSFLWSVDTKTGVVERHTDFWDQLTSLLIFDMDTSSRIPSADSVARLNISLKDKKMAVGDTVTVNAGVSPWNVENTAICWSSSDESVATVDENGNVTAVGIGSCDIIAVSAMDKTVSAACAVTVGNAAETESAPVLSEWAVASNADNTLKTASDDAKVTITLDLPTAAELTNGLQTVSIDTGDLTLLSIRGADLLSFSQKESLLTIGYVHKEAVAAGKPAVTLTFEANGCSDDRSVIMRELQRNNEHLKVQNVTELGSHVWSDWAEVTAADCDNEGLEKLTCSLCEKTEERALSALGHSWGEWNVTKAAGCLEDGLEQRTCSVCDITEDRAIAAAGSHNWGEWKVIDAATCLEDSTEQRTCSACDETEDRILSAVGSHAWGEWSETKAATCVNDGETARTCANCDTTETELIPATGVHIWSDWQTTVEPGETTEGEEKRICDFCDAFETNIIPAKGHICPAKDYTDLDITQWYHEGVDFVLANGYMNGMGNGLFEPNGDLTRAQLVTILYRIEGSPDVSALENPFTDLTQDWYINAVKWAAAEGVVYGVGNGRFAPDDTITREQIATILYRYSGQAPSEQNHIGSFRDAAQISDYAIDALNWAVSKGLIQGVGNNDLSPKSSATRAQIATILMRYLSA